MNDSGHPRISIITVCYNEAHLIEETIINVLSLKKSLVDYIIIDGNSTDGTVDIIKKYERKLKFWISEPDKGIYDAMNKGWEHADLNSFILYLGVGDKILKLPNNEDLQSDTIYYGDALLQRDQIYNGKKDFRLKIGNTLHHQSLLIPKKLNPTAPFNIKYKVYADFDFNQRLLKRKLNYEKTDQLLAYIMPDGFSQHYKTYEFLSIIKSNFGITFAVLGYLYFNFQKLKNIIIR